MDAFGQSDGVCLPHLRGVLAAASDGDPIAALLDAQKAIWSHLVGQLDELIRRSDYRFADERTAVEGSSWLRDRRPGGGA